MSARDEAKNDIAYRCGLQPTYKMIKLVKDEKALSKDQFDFLKRTPFFEFFNVFYEEKIVLKECKKHQENLDVVYACYSPTEEAFIFGQDKLKISEKDISLLFYMPLEGNNVEQTPKITNRNIPSSCKDFVLRNFGKAPYITKTLVEKRIEEEVGEKETQNDEDLPILLIMDMLITFFFPNNQQKLRWGFVQFLLDVEKLNAVSWPKTILANFSKNVKKFVHKPRNMSGCSMLPLYCMCEKMTLINQRRNYNSTLPRFARWDLMDLKSIVIKGFLSEVKHGQVVEVKKIEPHEAKLLETSEAVTTTSRSIKAADRAKRKRAENEEKLGSLQQEATIGVLKIQNHELEEEIKNLKEELKKERRLRKLAEEEKVKLIKYLNKENLDCTIVRGGKKIDLEVPVEDVNNAKTQEKANIDLNDEINDDENQNVDIVIDDGKNGVEKEDEKEEANKDEKEKANEDEDPNLANLEPNQIIEPSWTELHLSHCKSVVHLNRRQQRIVRNFFSKAKSSDNDVAWTSNDVRSGECEITKDMLQHVLEENFTEGQIIDWFSQKCALVKNSYAMSTLMTQCIMEERKRIITCLVIPFLEEVARNKFTKTIYFPINYASHWSLLTLSYPLMEWEHFDSKRPINSDPRNSPHFSKAALIKAEVEKMLEEIWRKLDIKDMQLGTSNIHQPNCAQQDCDSIDCGIYVIIFMASHNRSEVPLKVSKNNMLKIRANIVYEILSDAACCWNLVKYIMGLSNIN